MVIALQVSSQPRGHRAPGDCTPNPSGNFRLIPACLKSASDFEHILTINNPNSSQHFSGRVTKHRPTQNRRPSHCPLPLRKSDFGRHARHYGDSMRHPERPGAFALSLRRIALLKHAASTCRPYFRDKVRICEVLGFRSPARCKRLYHLCGRRCGVTHCKGTALKTILQIFLKKNTS